MIAPGTDGATTSLRPQPGLGSLRGARLWVVVWMVFGLHAVLAVVKLPRSDFGAYHRAAARVDRGENPYRLDEHGIQGTYRYPPAFAYLMTPLGRLDFTTAAAVWFAVNMATLAGCLLLALSLVLGPRPWPREAGVLALLLVVATSFYAHQNLDLGQIAPAMTLLCLGWAACRRAGRNFTGGALLAGACALKLAPAALVPYLVLRKDWRGLGGVAAGGALLALVPAPWVGVDGAIGLHRDWLRHAKDTQVPVQNFRVGNQGLMGMLARLPHVSNGRACYSDDNLAALDRHYPLLVAGLCAALYGWVAYDLRTRRRASGTGERDRENLHLSLLFIFMTLAHPCAWRCNFIALILPCALLARHALLRGPGSRLATTALALFAAGWLWGNLLVLVESSANWGWFGGVTFGRAERRSAAVWLAQGAHFWAALLVGWACWRVSRAGRG